MARSSADWLLDQVLVYAGLEGLGINTHSFRRTALTNLSNARVSLRVIQKINGHRAWPACSDIWRCCQSRRRRRSRL
ncbi:tyrosine-type recombinase/integrase [Nodosilinea sp. LEGE 07088]|uniref:tyrosine-type recombinase/integrase n=1 Tax=Nodosilinea sp. LEGE 07088 TaxID=2777968 RepID=UPI0034D97393